MTTDGWLAIAGLGPGAESLVTPEVQDALAAATDVVGYIPYVARVAPRCQPLARLLHKPAGEKRGGGEA